MLRLKELREERGLQQKQLAADLNVSQPTISDWESGRKMPSAKSMLKLASYFSCSVEFLTGTSSLRGIAYRPSPDLQQQDKAFADFAIRAATGSDPSLPPRTLIPVVGTVAAGLPVIAEDDILDYEEVTPETAARGELFGLRVKGSSMEPRIMEGDVVIVRRQSTAVTGDTVVCKVNGDEATVKKIKIRPDGWTLLPTNPAFDPLIFTCDEIATLPVTIIGKVIELRGKF